MQERIPVELLAEEVLALLARTSGVGELRRALRPVVTKLVAGERVTTSDVAEASGTSADHVELLLQLGHRAGWGAADWMTSLGLAQTPTPYRLRIDRSPDLFASTAVDALLIAVLAERLVRVQTSCLMTGARVEFDVNLDGVANAVPDGAVVAVLAHPERIDQLRPADWSRQGFFRGSDVAKAWLRDKRVYRVLSLHDAVRFAQRLASFY